MLLALAVALGSAPVRAEGVGISEYVLQIGPLAVPLLTTDTSGITYHPGRNTLFAISNRIEKIVELNLDGSLVRSIALEAGKFKDTEGIVYLGGDQFAFTEERLRNVVIATIAPTTTVVNYNSSRIIHLQNVPGTNNSGLEGIAYDDATDTFFALKEKDGQALYHFPTPPGTLDVSISVPELFDTGPFDLDDLAGLHFHDASATLLILSDDSRAVVETTLNGTELSRLVLPAFIGQPEGITVDATGKVYIVGEADEFYVFEKASHYQNWAAVQGFPAGQDAAIDDPDGNEVSNLLDYALGRAGGEPDPLLDMPIPSITSDKLQLTFTRPKSALGVCYLVQASDNFSTWSDEGVSLLKLSETATEETWRGDVLISQATKRALRLRVTLP